MKNNKGFSMMEILVAVAIVAVLGAITVPQYQKYMKDTQITAKDNSLTNVARAFAACYVLKGLDLCDTLPELGVTSLSSNNTPVVAKSTSGVERICVGVENTIGGVAIKSCVEANGQGGTTFTSNQGFCYKDGGAQAATIPTSHACNDTGSAYTCKTTWDGKCATACQDEKVVGSICAANNDCSPNLCKAGTAGTCATGDCS